MKKNTLFLSAAITTFILVVLASVILKARASVVVPPVMPIVPAATSTQAPTETMLPAETATMASTADAAFISPQEAVFIASTALGNTQVYSVDTVTRYGLDVYKVTFSSGHIVFVSPNGHILAINSPQAVVVLASDQQSGNQQVSADNSTGPSSQPRGSDDHDEGSGGDD